MQYSSIVAIMAVAVAAVSAVPTWPVNSSKGSCSSGTPQCCATTHDGAEAKKTLALLGLNDVVGMIGVSCQQIPINAVGAAVAVDNFCKQTAVCCEGSESNGLIQTGCSAFSVN